MNHMTCETHQCSLSVILSTSTISNYPVLEFFNLMLLSQAGPRPKPMFLMLQHVAAISLKVERIQTSNIRIRCKTQKGCETPTKCFKIIATETYTCIVVEPKKPSQV